MRSAPIGGGTPGTQNSVYDATPDTSGPQIISVTLTANDTLLIVFDEKLDSLTAVELFHYDIDNGIGNPGYAAVFSPDLTTLVLGLENDLMVNNVYTLTVSSIADCALNETNAQTALIAVPDTASPFDVVINEVMFNPPTGGFDYVEIYNRSDKTIDAAQLKLWNADQSGEPNEESVLTATSRLVPPGGFLLVTEDTAWVKANYFMRNDSTFIQNENMPGYNDDAGTVILTNAGNTVIDKLAYNADWHFALIDEQDGVSLERISYHAPTQDSMNWHSAATAVGYGTPGMPNSQLVIDPATNADLTLDPKVFSPDGDGYHDVLTIRYNFDSPGYTLNIKIFSEAGALVKDLVNGRLAEPNGFAIWDGTDERNNRALVGPYVVWVEAFNTNGDVKQFKEVCVLAGKQ